MAETPEATAAPEAPAAPVEPTPAAPPAPAAPAPAVAPAIAGPPTLDLTAPPDRPLVKLPCGDYRMRMPEELTFEHFGFQVSVGKTMIELAGDVDNPGVLDELQGLIVKGARLILVDLDDAAAATITPGMFQRISAFFHALAGRDETPVSGTASSSSPDASASSVPSATA